MMTLLNKMLSDVTKRTAFWKILRFRPLLFLVEEDEYGAMMEC